MEAKPTPIACDLHTLTEAEGSREQSLLAKIRDATLELRISRWDTPDGFRETPQQYSNSPSSSHSHNLGACKIGGPIRRDVQYLGT